MFASRLFWKLLIVCGAANLAAAAAIGVLVARGAGWAAVIVAIAFLAAMAWWIARQIVRPVASLTAAAETLVGGEYGQRVYVARRDELGALARTFNRLSQELSARTKQLGQTGDRQSTVLGGMIEGVIAVDARQRIVLANPAAGRLFDFRHTAAEGRPLIEVLRIHAVHEAVKSALASGQPQRLETKSTSGHVATNSRPAGGLQHIDLHVQPLPGEPCPGAVLVMHDTTELRRLESLRRDFMANVSHELKTPLSSIKAYTETLRNGTVHDAATSQTFLGRIEEQADRLHHLILDMLTLARIESDQQVFEIQSVDVGELVGQVVGDYRAAADAQQLSLAVEPNLPTCRVRADREGLREILGNLIDNAIKYTPAGGQVSACWRETERPVGVEANNGNGALSQVDGSALPRTVRIEVRDTGIGIRTEDQLRVFERFYRVDKARSRELGGTGLGLAIVKHLAQSFGGTVSVTSEPGQGSSFTVELPCA